MLVIRKDELKNTSSLFGSLVGDQRHAILMFQQRKLWRKEKEGMDGLRRRQKGQMRTEESKLWRLRSQF